MLSGDYDGDTAWICWDPAIVVPFRNTPVPEFPSLETYGIEKDSSNVSDLLPYEDFTDIFLRHSFQFNLQPSMLGICTNYHESLCYHWGSIDSPEAIRIGVLLGYLVDSGKGGFIFDEAKWSAYLKRHRLPRSLPPPAYKDRKKSREKEGNLIDKLVFHVAKEERERSLKSFTDRFKDVGSWDEDLVGYARQAMEESKTDRVTRRILRILKEDLEKIFAFWKENTRKEDEDDETLQSSKRGIGSSFRSTVEGCRNRFLALQPAVDEGCREEAYERMKCWQFDPSTGRWDLLKSSFAFLHYHNSFSFIWNTMGMELGEIKATKNGRGSYRYVVNPIHITLKSDSKLVQSVKSREMQLEELRKTQGSDEDEFGSDFDPTDL